MQVYKQESVDSEVLKNGFSSLQAKIGSLQAGFRTQSGSLKRVFKPTSKNCKSTSRISYAVWFFKTYFQVYKQEMQVHKQDSVDSEVLKNGFQVYKQELEVFKQDSVRNVVLKNELSSLQAGIASLQEGYRTQCGSFKRVDKSTSMNCKSTSRIPYAAWFFKTYFQVYKQELQVYKQDSVDNEVLKNGFSSLQARIGCLLAGFRTLCAYSK